MTPTEAIHRIIVGLGDLETPNGDAKGKIHLLLEADEEDEESVQEIEKAVPVKDSIRDKMKKTTR